VELTKCLVVDDDPVGRELMRTYLEKVQSVDVAVDGKDAIEKFQAAYLSGAPYQLIFLDIVMPDLSGHEVGKTIRAFEKEQGVVLGGQVKIVMLTSLKGAQDVMQAMMEAQSSAYLTKPVDPAKVRETAGKVGLSIPR